MFYVIYSHKRGKTRVKKTLLLFLDCDMFQHCGIKIGKQKIQQCYTTAAAGCGHTHTHTPTYTTDVPQCPPPPPAEGTLTARDRLRVDIRRTLELVIQII